MNIGIPSVQERQQKRVLTAIISSATIFIALTAVANLGLFLIFGKAPLLPIAAGSILCAIGFWAIRRLVSHNRVLLAGVLAEGIFGIYFLLHAAIWDNSTIGMLMGLWIFTFLIVQGMRTAAFHRLVIAGVAIVTSIIAVWVENAAFPYQLQSNDLYFMRAVVPTYVTAFGLFALQVSLSISHNQKLFNRILRTLVILVFIPIAVLSIISYYNSLLNDSQSASQLLGQILSEKNKRIQDWTDDQSVIIKRPLQQNETFLKILEVLFLSNNGLPISEEQVEPIAAELNAILAESDFQEILIMNRVGKVIVGTQPDLVGKDFHYMEFFWRAKTQYTILPPRYYPAADQTSIFLSHPIRDYSGQVIGVLSGRTTIDPILAIVQEPFYNIYPSTQIYLVNADGAILESSQGKPAEIFATTGALQMINTSPSGGSFTNIKGVPVIGSSLLSDELKIHLVAEANAAEVFAKIPTVISTNITIAITAFIFAFIASWAIGRSITSPINTLLQTSQEIIKGDLSIRAEIESNDEIGALAQAFNEMTEKLESFVANLEAMVEERTINLQQRTLELQTVAQIARDISLSANVEDLLNKTARLIRERFGFYHVGIFLNDSNNEYAVLRAAAGDAGKVMLANKHKLLIGEVGIVGYVAKWGEARIALDVGEDAVHFRNPLLPYTRSEMALPIKIGSKILGVLDVQSEKANAFDQNDITTMGILTDQLAIAVERTRLIQESQENALALEQALRGQTARAWRTYLEQLNKPRGYRYEGTRIEPLTETQIQELKQLTGTKPVILNSETKKQETIALVPIRLRGQTLGGLRVRFESNAISPNSIRILEDAADRLSLALENSRLLQEAQRVASQEQQINIISSQIQESTDLEIILQRTVKELGRSLGVPTAFIQVGLLPSETTEKTE
jgi:nitrate/nitrite-specific signal transduction histidine kinase